MDIRFSLDEVLNIALHSYNKGVEQGLNVDFATPADVDNFKIYIKEWIKGEIIINEQR